MSTSSLFQKEIDKFNTVAKRILKTEISKNFDTLSRYRTEIIEAYNIFVKYVVDTWPRYSEENRKIVHSSLERINAKFLECLNVLGCDHDPPTSLYVEIEEQLVGPVTREAPDTVAIDVGVDAAANTSRVENEDSNPKSIDKELESTNKEEIENLKQKLIDQQIELENKEIEKSKFEEELRIRLEKEQKLELENKLKQTELQKIEELRLKNELEKQIELENLRKEIEKKQIEEELRLRLEKEKQIELENKLKELERERIEEELRLERERENENRIMPLSQIDFLRAAAQTLSKNFGGNPLELTAFLNGIKLLQTIAADGNHADFLKTFIMTKLEGKALEAIPTNAQNVDEIIAALQEAIKPDNSKVIAGRMTALHVQQGNYVEFAKNVELLSDAFRRALIVEGIPQPKAQEMTIDKTVELCRASAKSQLVKSVLASTSFKTPNEVVAKLVVEQTTETKEAQILSFKTNRYKSGGRGNRNYRGNYNNNNNNNRNVARNGNNQNYNNNNNRNYSQNNSQNYSRNNNNNNNNNGRNFRNNNSRGRNNNNRQQYGNNNRSANVRVAENCDAPQQRSLGEAQN